MSKLNKLGKKDGENLLERFFEDPFGDFMRNRFPIEADEDKVKAGFRDGVLNIELPRSSLSEIKVDIK